MLYCAAMRAVRVRRAALVAAAIAIGGSFWAVGTAYSAPGDPKTDFNASDQAYARTLVLRQSDLPRVSWIAKPTDFSQPNPPCIVEHYSESTLTLTGRAGRTYTQQRGPTLSVIESDAGVFRSASQATADYTTLSKPGLARCFASSLTDNLLPGVTASVQKVQQLTFAGLPAPAHGFLIAVRYHSSQRGDIVVTAVVVTIRHGRAATILSFVRTGTPWPRTLENALVSLAAHRMTNR